jgi:hypothetical protein
MIQKRTGRVAEIRRFFEANPSEIVTYADLGLKLGCTANEARRAVEYLRLQGYLETMHIVQRCVGGASAEKARDDQQVELLEKALTPKQDAAFPGVDIDSAHRRAA